jgi:elongation factor P
MATNADIRNGMCIQYNNDIYLVNYFQHVKPGKGPAFVRTKMKSLTTGKVIDRTYSSGTSIDVANVERRPYQFLYKDESGYYFMHRETYEQINIDEKLIENADLLNDGQDVEVVFNVDTDTSLSCELPPFVVLEITYTEPVLRGNASSPIEMKPATLETGSRINVPIFLNTGDKIKIDTRAREYVERFKS